MIPPLSPWFVRFQYANQEKKHMGRWELISSWISSSSLEPNHQGNHPVAQSKKQVNTWISEVARVQINHDPSICFPNSKS